MKKNERLKLFDISLTILNFIAIVIIAILIFVNIVLTILSFFSTAVLFGLTLVIFSRKNPYYILSSSGMAICGFLSSIVLLTMPRLPFYSFFSIFFIVTIILDVLFSFSLLKVSNSPWILMSRWASMGMAIEPNTNAIKYIKDIYEPLGNGKSNKALELVKKREIRKKYYAWWILLITLISTFAFFSATIVSLL